MYIYIYNTYASCHLRNTLHFQTRHVSCLDAASPQQKWIPYGSHGSADGRSFQSTSTWTKAAAVWKMPSEPIASVSSLMTRGAFPKRWFIQLHGPLAVGIRWLWSLWQKTYFTSFSRLGRRSFWRDPLTCFTFHGRKHAFLWCNMFQNVPSAQSVIVLPPSTAKGSIPLFNGFSHLLAMLPRVVLPWNRSHFRIDQSPGEPNRQMSRLWTSKGTTFFWQHVWNVRTGCLYWLYRFDWFPVLTYS